MKYDTSRATGLLPGRQMAVWLLTLYINNNNNNNNNNYYYYYYYYYYYCYYYYLLQLGCYPVAVVILHVNKYEIGYY